MDTVWEVFHGQSLKEIVDQAHQDMPAPYHASQVSVQYLNKEWVVTVLGELDKEEQHEELFNCPPEQGG